MQDKNRKENRKEKPDIALINSEEYIIHHIDHHTSHWFLGLSDPN